MPKTLFDKIWDAHVVRDYGGGMQLLHVDRDILSDLGGARALGDLEKRGLKVRRPELTFATPDHVISTEPGRTGGNVQWATTMIDNLRTLAKRNGVRVFDIDDGTQGIVHILGPEMGLTVPGALVVCADSHTCTNGGLGAMGFGIGASEQLHVLATQTVLQKRPQRLRAHFTGRLPFGVEAKDMILALIARHGAAAGSGFAIEYTGEPVRALSPEARMTLCNLSIEMAAKIGLVAPDDTVFEYVKGRPYAPRGLDWDRALDQWRGLPSDPDASYERELQIDCSALAPQITWGTGMDQVLPVDGTIPDPSNAIDATQKRAWEEALLYMGLQPGERIAGQKVDRVFIGSCTNARITDLRAAAKLAKGRKVAQHVRAWVVPGSLGIKRQAEAEGLHRTFIEAGFEWREPGCSMCLGANDEVVAPQARCVSTSNRNFVGRQGPQARTHIASPAMAVAAAIAGEITDVRTMRAEA